MTADAHTPRTTMHEQLAARIEELRAGPGYANYRWIRDWVLEVKSREAAAGHFRPSEYWSEELTTLDHLFDASPLVVDQLRHHAYTVTGLRAYDYRTNKSDARERFRTKMEVLKDFGDASLLVPESRTLGGFGHDFDGELYNIDTLKYFEVLLALDKAAVLGHFRDVPPGERRVAWEIGAGWGGFPYVFKTLFPETTYAIVDLPELFLFSGTYLRTVFPDATFLLHGRDDLADPEAWAAADFVFVPNTALDDLTPPHVDLAINMVSFQEMTGDQVASYVEKAHALGAPYLYSLNRERSHYNTELESVSATIDRWYWPHEIPMLPVNYMKMLRDTAKPAKKAKLKVPTTADAMEYRHIVGKRRMVS